MTDEKSIIKEICDIIETTPLNEPDGWHLASKIYSEAIKKHIDVIHAYEVRIMQYRHRFIPDHPNRKEFDEFFGITSRRVGQGSIVNPWSVDLSTGQNVIVRDKKPAVDYPCRICGKYTLDCNCGHGL